MARLAWIFAISYLGLGVFQRERVEIITEDKSLFEETQLARDIERFRWLSGDSLFQIEARSGMLADARYSMLPNQLRPLWGIVLNFKELDKHVMFESFRDFESGLCKELIEMLFAPRSGKSARSRDPL